MRWDAHWQSLDNATRETLAEMEREGLDTEDGFLASRPDVPDWCVDLYEMFYECDRDFNGNLTFSGMNDVLREYGITSRHEMKRYRTLFRQMSYAMHEARDEAKGK